MVAPPLVPAQAREIFGAPDDNAAHRARALVARLTLDEKVAQLQNDAPEIVRLGIPAYNWWSESLHGVARNGVATVFPQAIGLAATFDEELLRRVGAAIADEARAKFDADGGPYARHGRYQGLTFFAPNLNIFRDPRWGRGQETYGEDPFLTARLGVAYVRGLQGDQGRPLKVAAVAKHFAVHSGPERARHRFNARVDAHDLADTYLPQFEAVVREGKVAGVMAAYNRVNGSACVANTELLGTVLRRQWGFDGFVVGDCGAVQDLVSGHGVARDEVHAAALALRAGTDLDCGRGYRYLTRAVTAGLVTEKEVDAAAARLFTVRFRLGLLDGLPAKVTTSVSDHSALAREAAQKSLVLLENDGILPIAPGVRRIAVVGPVADDVNVLLGNYHGEPRAPITLLAGIRTAAARRGITVDHAPGVALTGRSLDRLPQAVAMARAADLVIATLGMSPVLEGEADDPDGVNAEGDRSDLGLPGAQGALLSALLRTGKPTVVVLTGGSAIALPAGGDARPRAVLMAWYPGEQGGGAVADALFGDVAPSGRLPVTFYRSVAQLPPFDDYAMAGRTYRYFEGQPLYPFGHGVRYVPVSYGPLAVVTATNGATVESVVENRGDRSVDEVVQVYAAARPRQPGDPRRALIAFRRVTLPPHQQQAIRFDLPRAAFSRVDGAGRRQPASGTWEITLGDRTAAVTLAD